MFRSIHVPGLLLLVLLGAIGFMFWSSGGSPGIVPAPLAPGVAADGEDPRLVGRRSISQDQTISDEGEATGSSPSRSTDGEYWRWIRGEVRSKLTQIPIEGGLVQISDGSRQGEAVSDPEGSFEIEWLGADHFTMSLSAPGFEERKHPGMNWEEEPLELEMNPLGAVFGTFERPTGLMQEPFGEVQFFRGALSNAARKPAHVFSLTAEPHFKAQLSAGTWSLALHRKDQSSSFETSFEVRMGEETTLHLPLSPSLIYRGKVVFKHGNDGVPGVALDLRQEVAGVSRAVRRSLQLSCVSGEDGSFAFEGLSPGNVLISLRTPWGQPLNWRHLLTAQNNGREERVVVAPPGSIAGQVRKHDGSPVPHEVVQLAFRGNIKGDGRKGSGNAEDADLAQETKTDESGRFVFERVAANRPVSLQVQPTPDLLAELDGKGIQSAFVTLHIGLDTFRPVQEDDPREHHIHSEYGELGKESASLVNRAKAEGRRIVCVGTTSVRLVEAVAGANEGKLRSFLGRVDLFILPGFRFLTTDVMLTNFHLPRTTLLMLSFAFAGRDFLLRAYQEAIDHRYRFYSFGDAMLIL